MTIRIKVRHNGPYVIDLAQGGAVLTDQAGDPVALPEGATTVTLCRCGQSQAKPFCDGTHLRVGFTAADAMPHAAGDDAHVSAPHD